MTKWHTFLVTLGKISKFDDKWATVLSAIRKAVKGDPSEEQWINDTFGSEAVERDGETFPAIESVDIIGVDPDPDEVELSVDEALTTIRRQAWSPPPTPDAWTPPRLSSPPDLGIDVPLG